VSTTVPASRLSARRVPHLSRVVGQPGGRTIALGLSLIGLVLLASALRPLFLPPPNQQDLLATLAPPSLAHPFGTDDLGRDVLSRTLAATWLDLALGIGITFVAVVVGVTVGTLAGYIGGWVDRVITWVVDAVIAFPYLVFVLAVITIVGPGVAGLAIGAIGATWAFYARLSRAEMLVLREKQFIQAAGTLGFSRRRVMLRHGLPNLIRPIAVYSMSDVVQNILAVAALSYLGLGVPPPTPEWGAIIEDGNAYLLTAWWISTLPGLVVVVVGLGFVLIGDGLGERLGVRTEAVA
jgi:peptide/nickel transport system permease protein